MNTLMWITKEAKKLRREYPRRFKTWKEYVAQASAIYAKKHKGRSPVGKPRKKKTVARRRVGNADSNATLALAAIGSTYSHNVHAAKKKLTDRLGFMEAAKMSAKGIRSKKEIGKKIAELKKKYRNLIAAS